MSLPVTTTPIPVADARGVLTPREFEGVRATVQSNNPGMTEAMSSRITEEGVKFVVAAARFPDVPMAPSRVVDEGWHALILHTRLYAALCERFGPFVHHAPGYDPTHYDPPILDRTRDAIRAAGFDVDPDLWRGPTDDGVPVAARCQHAHHGDDVRALAGHRGLLHRGDRSGLRLCGAPPALIMEAVPVPETAAANGLNALMRSIGTTVSSAVAGLILAHMTTDFHSVHIPTENGLRAVLALGVGAGVLSLTFANLIPRRPRPTEVPARGVGRRETRGCGVGR